MFERWITREHDRARLMSSTLCEQLVFLARTLESEGYAPSTLRRYLFAAEAFGRWIHRRGWSIDDVDESRLMKRLDSFHRQDLTGRAGGRLPDAASGVRKFAEVLRTQGEMPLPGLATTTPVAELVAAFDQHLAQVAGLSSGTRRIYGRYAKALLGACFGAGPANWKALDADILVEFVRAESSRLKVSACRGPVTATRTLLRFLVSKGLVAIGLVGAVPTVRQWKQASLPNHISTDQVAAVIATCSEVTPTGRRDRAIVTTLAGLGLRASEVASLRLDDILWRDGIISVRGAKSGRERSLPLPSEVGAAVAAYLREGRPISVRREVFLAVRAPHQAISPAAISSIAAHALVRAGIHTARCGAHVFRHTVATRMVRAGATFKDIADVLGHARIETTIIYAKLDVRMLATVALPWPEVAR